MRPLQPPPHQPQTTNTNTTNTNTTNTNIDTTTPTNTAWMLKTRRSPSRHGRDARVYGHIDYGHA